MEMDLRCMKEISPELIIIFKIFSFEQKTCFNDEGGCFD